METFEVQGPDGEAYDVQAPSFEEAVKTVQQVPASVAGPTVEAAQQLPQQENDEPWYSGIVNDPANTARSVAQGITFNSWDEIEGAARSMFGPETYEQNRDEIRSNLQQFAQQNPGTAMTAELLGAIALPGLGAGKLAASGARTAAKLAGYGAISAGSGAANDLGSALTMQEGLTEAGDPGRRALDAALGAGLGLGAEKLLPAVARGLRNRTAGGRTNNIMREAMLASGKKPAAILDEFDQLGPRAMPANVSESAALKVQSAAAQGGNPDILKPAFRGQRAGTEDDLIKSFGPRSNRFLESAEEAAEKAAIDEGFTAVRKGDGVYDFRGKLGDAFKELNKLRTPKGDTVSNKLGERMSNTLREYGFHTGKMTPEQTIGLVEALEDTAKKLEYGSNGRRLWTSTIRKIREEAYEKIPGYREVTTRSAQQRAREDAAEFAETMLNPGTSSSDLASKIELHGPEYEKALRDLAPDILIDHIEKSQRAGLGAMETRAMRKKLDQLFPTQQAADIARQYKALRKFSENAGGIVAGSKTSITNEGKEQLKKGWARTIKDAAVPTLLGGAVAGPAGAAVAGGAKVGAGAIADKMTSRLANKIIEQGTQSGAAGRKYVKKRLRGALTERASTKGGLFGTGNALQQERRDKDPLEITIEKQIRSR